MNKNYKFLRFITTSTPEKYSDDPYIICKLPATHENANRKDKLIKSIDIGDIINTTMISNKLLSLHEHVTNNIPSLYEDEIDLNFVITNITAKNFRSIKFLNWTPNNGVTVIHGRNGTGKSTLVDIIRYGLEGFNRPKKFVSHNESEMEISITLIYNNITYKLIRGYNGSGYIDYYINESKIEFENQSAGKERITKDLPFINMMDMLVHPQSRPRFLSSYNYSARVALISKIIGLSVVEKLAKKSAEFKDTVQRSYDSLDKEAISIKGYIESLSNLNLNNLGQNYDNDIETHTNIIGMLNISNNLYGQLASKDIELSGYKYATSLYDNYDFTLVNESTENLELELTDIDTKILNQIKLTSTATKNLLNIKSTIDKNVSTITNTLKSIELETQKINSLVAKECYTCHSIINEDTINKLKLQSEELIVKFKQKIDEINQSSAELLLNMNEAEKLENSEKETLSLLINQKTVLTNNLSKINEVKNAYSKYQRATKSLKNINEKIDNINSDILTNNAIILKEFDIDITNAESALVNLNDQRDKLSYYNTLKNNQESMKIAASELEIKKNRLLEINNKILSLKMELDDWNKYISLVSSNGIIIRSVLSTVSNSLSTENIQVLAYKTLANNETRPDFNLSMKVAGNWTDYDELSGGQQSVADMFILNHLINLIGGSGLLIFDETYGQLDTENLEFTINLLKNMQVNHIFIVSHESNFPYYDYRITTNFDTDGSTTYNFL